MASLIKHKRFEFTELFYDLVFVYAIGEMIMGTAEFFTPENVTINSVFYFIMMVAMFLYYFGQFDHALDEEADKKGLFLAGLILSLVFATTPSVVIIISMLMVLAIQLHFSLFYTKHSYQDHGSTDWEMI